MHSDFRNTEEMCCGNTEKASIALRETYNTARWDNRGFIHMNGMEMVNLSIIVTWTDYNTWIFHKFNTFWFSVWHSGSSKIINLVNREYIQNIQDIKSKFVK